MPRDLTQETVKRLFSYDAESGELRWRPRTPNMFAVTKIDAEVACRRWNSRCAGKLAGRIVKSGYIWVRISEGPKTDSYRAHRIIWLYVHGEWPEVIDHIDGNGLNNRLANLRNATRSQNQRNRAMNRNNKSGVMGVFFDPRLRKWTASAGDMGTLVIIGRFETIDEAAKARVEWSAENSFHPNHGRDAVHGVTDHGSATSAPEG